ncbi:Protein kinase domain [Trypanosoma melophagium]|uniref:Protein kinase domain n=1 Tax=Trypanosoma melophagium TaxID=715481 RepID=UPI00351A8088|nr:Protein kinase domain [Trypanosoma melophagium]
MESTSSQPTSNQRPTGITRVEDKYLIDEDAVVGRGAWSVVKRCTPIAPYTPPGSTPDMKIVVKIIEKEYLISLTKGNVERAMAEVKREIDVLRHIPPHENVVTFLEYIETEKEFLLFFEEVQCGDLCEIILQSSEGKLSEEKSKLYTYQIIKAVLHCHIHDVIHRDIKPENLLVSNDDNIKLTDFGLAKRSKGVCTSAEPRDPLDPVALFMEYPGAERLIGKRVVCSDVIGTPRYGSPEMFYAKFTQTHYDGFKADTWSVGVVTYITLSGSFPYSAAAHAPEKEVFRTIMDTVLPVPPGMSPIALDFVQRLLNKDPHKRISLYDALGHPWLEGVAQTRESVMVPRILETFTSAEMLQACKMFNKEAQSLHQCIRLLQRENQRLRDEQEKWEEAVSSRDRDAHRTSTPRRAETPSGTSRARTTRTPGASSSLRVTSPARTGVRPGRSSFTNESSNGSVRRPSAHRISARSPLARSAASTVRRGTPLRAGGTTPIRAGTPSRTTGRSTSAARGVSRPANNGVPSTPVAQRASTPGRTGTRSTTPSRSSMVSHVTSAKELNVGETVTYKGYRAVVRFNGPTAFGAGIWIGLEMMEGNEGTNDGSSFIDKKQYFTCPKGKGVFVRASQVKKL